MRLDNATGCQSNPRTGGGPCIDSSQQKGKVYTIDVTGNVEAQLQQVFNEIAAILKLRLIL